MLRDLIDLFGNNLIAFLFCFLGTELFCYEKKCVSLSRIYLSPLETLLSSFTKTVNSEVSHFDCWGQDTALSLCEFWVMFL